MVITAAKKKLCTSHAPEAKLPGSRVKILAVGLFQSRSDKFFAATLTLTYGHDLTDLHMSLVKSYRQKILAVSLSIKVVAKILSLRLLNKTAARIFAPLSGSLLRARVTCSFFSPPQL